ncbi:Hypoxia up-regulated protein 1 [Hypsibius exemplaris]|uniref:Hypoxia up-regulated protein 1 n=1 Tax=Hypsibius exemplaris TaxID=2072580 RepID=A0A1W0XAC7_HYPEX|nr:Hypoxia up-regulated protein 1 [Hypsibius exemplaris]
MESRTRVWLFLFCFGLAWRSSAALATMSIDLSSEYLKIAIVKPGVPMEIVLNTESHRKTPLAVAIRNGERTFGDAALGTCVRSPKSCFVFFLDLLGKNTSHPLVKLYQERFPQYDLVDDPVSGRAVFKLDDGTFFAPEELLAMILKYARGLAEKYAEQPISDAVIAIPPFYTQIERISINYAAKMAGLTVLQLLNDNTAAALNYGVFRRKEMNATMQYIMLYDMGSTSTTATIIGYHVTKLKDTDGKSAETAQLVIKGVGYDRTLGGLEIDLRLRKFFVEKFQEKTKKNAAKNPGALVKLLKEAARVKRVLSANNEHQAQVEGLMDDVDFSTKITRAELESMCSDVFARIPAIIEQALMSANIGGDEIQQVIVLGGGTRIPKVQEELLKAVRRKELGKNLNSDEAIALGAVYQAAHLSKGFRVMTLDLVDTTIFPIVVEFERGSSSNSDSDEATNKLVKRVLFARSNGYPLRKVLTFPKHTTDFEFSVRYADYDFLSAAEQSYIGNSLQFKIGLQGVTDAFAKHADKRPKGVKTHFRVDQSGLFFLEQAEASFEYEKEEEVPSTIEKLGQSISNFFSGSPDNSTTTSENATQPEAPGQEINAATGVEAKENATTGNGTEPAGKVFSVTLVNKTMTVKEKLKDTITRLDLAVYPEKTRDESKKRLREMDEKDQEKQEREKARNILETYVFDIQDKLYQPTYEKASTEEEREVVLKSFREASEWLEEEAAIQTAAIYKKKLRGLEDAMKDIADRVSEAEKRPRVLADLDKHLNTSRTFLELAKNASSGGIFSDTETGVLEKLVADTEEWIETNVKLQEAAPANVAPLFRVLDVVEKIRALDREVKYMINKAKIGKPKVKPETVKKEKKKKADNFTVIGDEPVDGESTPANGTEESKPEQEYTFKTDEELAQEKSAGGQDGDSSDKTDEGTSEKDAEAPQLEKEAEEVPVDKDMEEAARIFADLDAKKAARDQKSKPKREKESRSTTHSPEL